MIHLDTNVAIGLLSSRASILRRRFDAATATGRRFALSAIALHELHYGASASARPLENVRKLDAFLVKTGIDVLPLTPDDAREAGDIRAELRRAGTPIGPYDLLIAAQARRARATLVTSNTREFARVPGLAVLDWAAEP